MTARAPRVSVVVPTRDRAAYLGAAIDSVLAQTMGDLELIVVDHASVDETHAVLDMRHDARLRVLRVDEQGGAARARNAGVAAARAPLVAFLDSDDLWLPDKLARQIEALDGAPGCRWSYTLFDHVDERGAWMAPLKGGVGKAVSGAIVRAMVTEEALVAIPTVLAETSLVLSIGGFDESPGLREDLDFCLRLAVKSPVCAVADSLTRVRHHPGRTTFGLPEVRAWRVRALDKLAASTPDSTLRRLCRSESARELVDLADVLGGSGDLGRAVSAVIDAARHAPANPAVWRVLVKTLVRPLTPAPIRAAYRRRMASASRAGGHGPDARTTRHVAVGLLGVELRVSSDSAEVIDRVSDAYGVIGRSDRRDVPHLTVEVDDSLGDASSPPSGTLPERDTLLLEGPGIAGAANSREGTASLRISTAALSAPWLREAVLDHLALFLVTARDRTPLHSAAIARRGTVLLLSGSSGSGKSSLAYAAGRAGWRVLAEDVVFVQTAPETTLWALPRGIHLTTSAVHHFPELDGVRPVTRPDGRRKLSVEVPAAERATSPWRGRTALCLLAEGDPGYPTIEAVPTTEAIAAVRATLDGGFHRFGDALDACVRAVGGGSCWRLRRNATPDELVGALERLSDEMADRAGE